MTTMCGQPSKLVPSDSRSPSTPIRRTAGLRRILLGTEDAHAVYAKGALISALDADAMLASRNNDLPRADDGWTCRPVIVKDCRALSGHIVPTQVVTVDMII